MKKSSILILSIITAITLCGCETKLPDNSRDSSVTNSGENSTASSTDSTTESIPNNSATEETTEKGEPLVLIGPDGNTVPEEDYISAFGTEWNEIPTTGLTTENFNRVKVEGSYVMMPTGCRTVNDHADVFDSENNVFTDLLPQHKTEFIRVKAGDEICGFKVKSAVSYFESKDGAFADELHTDPKTGADVYFSWDELELEGEIELTGYLKVITRDQTFWSTGDIRFVPADREVNLPVIDYEFDPDEGFYHSVGERIPPESEALRYANEYRAIKLDPAAVDISGIPDDNSWIKVRVKLNNISMSCTTYSIMSGVVLADIIELTIL